MTLMLTQYSCLRRRAVDKSKIIPNRHRAAAAAAADIAVDAGQVDCEITYSASGSGFHAAVNQTGSAAARRKCS